MSLTLALQNLILKLLYSKEVFLVLRSTILIIIFPPQKFWLKADFQQPLSAGRSGLKGISLFHIQGLRLKKCGHNPHHPLHYKGKC